MEPNPQPLLLTEYHVLVTFLSVFLDTLLFSTVHILCAIISAWFVLTQTLHGCSALTGSDSGILNVTNLSLSAVSLVVNCKQTVQTAQTASHHT